MRPRAAAALALAAVLATACVAASPPPPAPRADPHAIGVLEAQLLQRAAAEEAGAPVPPPAAPTAEASEGPSFWKGVVRVLEWPLMLVIAPIVLLHWLLGGDIC